MNRDDGERRQSGFSCLGRNCFWTGPSLRSSRRRLPATARTRRQYRRTTPLPQCRPPGLDPLSRPFWSLFCARACLARSLSPSVSSELIAELVQGRLQRHGHRTHAWLTGIVSEGICRSLRCPRRKCPWQRAAPHGKQPARSQNRHPVQSCRCSGQKRGVSGLPSGTSEKIVQCWSLSK